MVYDYLGTDIIVSCVYHWWIWIIHIHIALIVENSRLHRRQTSREIFYWLYCIEYTIERWMNSWDSYSWCISSHISPYLLSSIFKLSFDPSIPQFCAIYCNGILIHIMIILWPIHLSGLKLLFWLRCSFKCLSSSSRSIVSGTRGISSVFLGLSMGFMCQQYCCLF